MDTRVVEEPYRLCDTGCHAGDYRVSITADIYLSPEELERYIRDGIRIRLAEPIRDVPSIESAKQFLGKHVRVALDGETVVTGRLLAFGQDGEFEIMESDGTIHYCWPMLDIEEIP